MELIVAVIGIFIIGLGTIVWWIGQAIRSVFSKPQGSTPARPSAPVPAPDRTAVSVKTLSRAEMLSLWRKEAFEAMNSQQISSAAFREIRDYIDNQRGQTLRSASPLEQLLAKPSTDRDSNHLPLLDLLESQLVEPETPQEIEPPTAPKPAFEDPERIRNVYAKLRAHSEAPATSERTKSEPIQAASRPQLVEKPREEKVAPAIPQLERKPFGERLFTPENVRILQSLGICIIFLSTVAFVRTKMWEEASGVAQIAWLMLGTAACTVLGFVLRRWTSLRITGLGFLILGQLSLIIDTYAALFSTNTAGLYPYSPESLWTVSFTLFSAIAFWHARSLKEPLFDAFSFLGALAAWGCGAFWLDLNPWLLPAAFVPLVCLIRFGSRILPKPEASDVSSPIQRWSLPWWLDHAFLSGAPLLAAALLCATFYCGKAVLSQTLFWHCAAMVLLACGFLIHSWRNARHEHIHAAAALLLAPGILMAYANQWPLQSWALALVLPGSLLAVSGLMSFHSAKNSSPRIIIDIFSVWGSLSAAAAVVLTVLLRLQGNLSHEMTLTCVCALGIALAFAIFQRALWAPWAMVAVAGFLTTLLLDLAKMPHTSWPSVWLALAALVFVAYRFSARLSKNENDSFEWHMRFAADALALVAACMLVGFSPMFPGTVANNSFAMVAGWWALAAYALMTSAILQSPVRRCAAVVLLSPALTYLLYNAGFDFAQPAPFLAMLVLLVIAAATLAGRIETPSMLSAAMLGSAIMLAHGYFFGIWQLSANFYSAAEVSFVTLAAAAAVMALRLRTREALKHLAVYAETTALMSLAATGMAVLQHHQIYGFLWAASIMLIGAAAVLVAMIGEFSSSLFKMEVAHPDDRPFRSAGEIVALLLSAVAAFALIVYGSSWDDPAGLLLATWVCALLPLFIALRPRRSPETEWAGTTGFVLAAGLMLITAGHSLYAEFWSSLCATDLREACAVFFAVLFAASVTASAFCMRSADLIARKFARFTPITAMLSLIGLLGCAYGAFSHQMPVESFGLCCAILACGAWGLAGGRRGQSSAWLESGLTSALRFAAALAVSFGCIHMLFGIAGWPTGKLQAFPALAWLLSGAGMWMHCSNTPRYTRRAALAGLSLTFAAMHAMRLAGLEFSQFGPWLIVVAAVLLSLRQFALSFMAEDDTAPPPMRMPAPLHGRAGGLVWAAMLTAIAGGVLGFWGWLDGHVWHTCATLAEGALCVAALTVIARRENREHLPAHRIIALELFSWLLLAFAIGVGTSPAAANIPMAGAWILVAALFLLIGMAAEALLGALVSRKQDDFPGIYLESRHIAAFALAAFNILAVLTRSDTVSSEVGATWRAIFSAAALAVYGSFARSSANESWTGVIRKTSGIAAYVVLLPVGYLCLLKAHSTGSSWGAMCFMLLSPVLLIASYVLERENQRTQSAAAKLGALFVSVGSVLLAYFGNRENLAAVPALAFAAVAVQTLLMRMWTRDRQFSLATCLIGTFSAFYAIRAISGFPAWGEPNPWAWETPCLAALGLAMGAFGSLFKIEPDENDRSAIARFGVIINIVVLGGCLMQLIGNGLSAKYFPEINTQRLDALIACLVISAMTSLLAKRSLEFDLSRFFAPAALMSAYFLAVWKEHPHAWEWYSLPAAIFLFGWAARLAHENKKNAVDREDELSAFITLASALAVIPSFAQSLPMFFEHTAPHFFVLLGVSLAMVVGAMVVRRKIPLLFASSAIVLGTLIQAIQWAQHQRVLLPVVGIAIGFAVLALGSLFESRMNQVFRQALDRAKAEARIFWVSWQ